MALGLNYERLRSVTSGDAYRESQIGVSPYIVGFVCDEMCLGHNSVHASEKRGAQD
jgi:hypothetical protein